MATELPGKSYVERNVFAKMAHRRSSLPVEEIVKLGSNEHLKNHQACKRLDPKINPTCGGWGGPDRVSELPEIYKVRNSEGKRCRRCALAKQKQERLRSWRS